MKLANNIKLTVFAKEGDDEKAVEEALKSLVPFDIEKEKIQISRKICVGFEEKKITVLSVYLEKEKHMRFFLQKLCSALSKEQKEILLRQAESRFDEQFNFFIRIDKEKLERGEYLITDSGNCFHIKIKIACFPRKREKGLSIIHNIFTESF